MVGDRTFDAYGAFDAGTFDAIGTYAVIYVVKIGKRGRKTAAPHTGREIIETIST
jgi:hypothetical protein